MDMIEFSSEHFLCELILKMTKHGLFYDGKPSLWRKHHLGGILSMSFVQKNASLKIYNIFNYKWFPQNVPPLNDSLKKNTMQQILKSIPRNNTRV